MSLELSFARGISKPLNCDILPNFQVNNQKPSVQVCFKEVGDNLRSQDHSFPGKELTQSPHDLLLVQPSESGPTIRCLRNNFWNHERIIRACTSKVGTWTLKILTAAGFFIVIMDILEAVQGHRQIIKFPECISLLICERSDSPNASFSSPLSALQSVSAVHQIRLIDLKNPGWADSARR